MEMETYGQCQHVLGALYHAISVIVRHRENPSDPVCCRNTVHYLTSIMFFLYIFTCKLSNIKTNQRTLPTNKRFDTVPLDENIFYLDINSLHDLMYRT